MNLNHSQRRSGFTLIELLVVIAIIAILAAILFPVFQSVRENARAIDCVSNEKQIALGMIQYTNDNDEKYPFGTDGAAGQGWNTHNVYIIPASAATPGAQTDRANDFWANSIQSYLKSYAVYQCKDSTVFNISAQPTSRPNITYTYNGDLQCSTLAAVLSPSAVPLVWPGELKNALVGVATANPILNCAVTDAPCVYQAPDSNGNCAPGNGGTRSSVVFGVPNGSGFAHHSGDNFAYCDGHVKFVNYTITPNTRQPGSPAGSPFGLADASGDILVNGSYGLYTDGCGGPFGFTPDFNP